MARVIPVTLLLLPLLSSCVLQDVTEVFPEIHNFESYLSAVLRAAVVYLVYTFFAAFIIRDDWLLLLVFFILMVVFSPYGFFMSVLVALGAILLGVVILAVGRFILAFVGGMFE